MMTQRTSYRLIISLAVVCFSLLLTFIPVPGISWGALRNLASELKIDSLEKYYFFWSHFLLKTSIVAFGIRTFLIYCILIQIFSLFIKPLREKLFGGGAGRKSLLKIIIFLSIVTVIIQSFFISLWFENPQSFTNHVMVIHPGSGFRALCVLSMTSGFILLLLLAEVINRYGLGNGYAFIFISHYLIKLPVALVSIFEKANAGLLKPEAVVLTFIIFIALIIVSIWATRWVHRVTLETDSGHLNVPVKLQWLGQEPIGWTGMIILLPSTILTLIPGIMPLYHFNNLMASNVYVYLILYALFIVIWTLFYKRIIYQDRSILKTFQVMGISFRKPFEQVRQLLNAAVKRAMIMTDLFLISVFCLPILLSVAFFPLPNMLSSIFRDLHLIVMIGIVCDTLEHVRFYKTQSQSGKDWSLCYVAFDEMEQSALCHQLNSKGIQTLIKPYRFSWGMPIRTPVEQYQIFVPKSDLDRVSLQS